MNRDKLDEIIAGELAFLREEKEQRYKLRTFSIEMDVLIEAKYGVEESLQAIRSISGVTVVTAIDSTYRSPKSSYISRIKIKFHPERDTIHPSKYVERILVPQINGKRTPGVKLIRVVGQPEQIG